MQALPSEEDYNKLREKRASEIQRKIAAERQAAMNAQEKERQDRERIERERLVKDGLASPEDDSKPGHRRAASGGEIQKKKMLVGKIPVPNVMPKGLIRNQSDENVGKGWKPVEDTARVSAATDPMLQQMEIIKGYIRQAKQANRTDEIIMLEQNLQDLYAEYMRQQQRKEHLNS